MNYIGRAKALARLARDGSTEGERDSAARQLAVLIDKHSDDLWPPSAKEKPKRIDAEDVAHWFAGKVAQAIKEDVDDLDLDDIEGDLEDIEDAFGFKAPKA